MNHLDLAIIAIVSVSAIVAFFRGFVRESLSLATWIISIWFGVRCAQPLSGVFAGWIEHEQVRVAVAFFAVFFVVLVAGSLISYFLSRIIKATPLSGIDRILGILFGVARGAVLIVLVAVIGPFLEVHESQTWTQSWFMNTIQPVAKWVNQFLPTFESKR